MLKSFASWDSAIAFINQSGYIGSRPFKRLIFDELTQSKIVVWSVQIHWQRQKAICSHN